MSKDPVKVRFRLLTTLEKKTHRAIVLLGDAVLEQFPGLPPIVESHVRLRRPDGEEITCHGWMSKAHWNLVKQAAPSYKKVKKLLQELLDHAGADILPCFDPLVDALGGPVGQRALGGILTCNPCAIDGEQYYNYTPAQCTALGGHCGYRKSRQPQKGNRRN
jgi:hypothetical protein